MNPRSIAAFFLLAIMARAQSVTGGATIQGTVIARQLKAFLRYQ